jgi:pilus assembly protein CpaE
MPLSPRQNEVTEEVLFRIALIGPDERRRTAVIDALSRHPGLRVQEFTSFPPLPDDLAKSLRDYYDIVIVDVDSNPEYVFDLATNLCADGHTYVMTYSAKANMQVAVQMMRAGVREFLTLPIDTTEVAAALARASSRHFGSLDDRTAGKLFVFMGTKGGCGVTTLASNFALAVAEETEHKTLIVDLGQPLGDVAINLGVVSEYSVATALQNPSRLDSNLLNTLVAKHDTGLAVLPAPGDFTETQLTKEGIDRLLTVALSSYDYVVVDAGSRMDLMGSKLFESSATVYLVSQVGISELRNANRIITKYFFTRDQNLQIVLNRYKPGGLLVDEEKISEVLTRDAHWKVPDDYTAARRTRETATPMVMIDSDISRVLRDMARTAAGVSSEKDSKRGFLSFLR